MHKPKSGLAATVLRRVGSCLLLALTLQYSQAQKAGPAALNWQLDATVKGVRFYHTITNCEGKKVVFLKLNNTNAYKVEVAWKDVFTTQEGANVKSDRGQKKLVLQTGETLETNCSNPLQKELVVLPDQVKMSYVADISEFGYEAITVSKSN